MAMSSDTANFAEPGISALSDEELHDIEPCSPPRVLLIFSKRFQVTLVFLEAHEFAAYGLVGCLSSVGACRLEGIVTKGDI